MLVTGCGDTDKKADDNRIKLGMITRLNASEENFGEFMKRMIIPIIVIGTSGTCGIIRSVRAQMLDEVAQQYTLTARAKGVKESTIIMKYCFRAAINPTVSGLGGILSSLFSGSTVTALVLRKNRCSGPSP